MNDDTKFRTDFLFSTPSFLEGAGSVMNLAGNYYEFNNCDTAREADETAINNDFSMIGQDICDAIKSIKG